MTAKTAGTPPRRQCLPTRRKMHAASSKVNDRKITPTQSPRLPGIRVHPVQGQVHHAAAAAICRVAILTEQATAAVAADTANIQVLQPDQLGQPFPDHPSLPDRPERDRSAHSTGQARKDRQRSRSGRVPIREARFRNRNRSCSRSWKEALRNLTRADRRIPSRLPHLDRWDRTEAGV